jgi:hypothetical protein
MVARYWSMASRPRKHTEMQHPNRTLTQALRAATAVLAMLLTSASPGQSRPASPTDLSGVWFPASDARGFPQTQWVGAELPFTAAGRARFDANVPGKGPREVLPAYGNDPIGTANPPGLFRTLVYPRPWEFIQLPDKVVQIFEWGKHWRTIWTDGRGIADEIVSGPFWYGYSVGRWEGDTLVVTTNNLDGRQWIDEWGTPISEYDATIEERWTRVGDDRLELTITIRDPELYAHPWTSALKTYALQPKDAVTGEPLEQIFAPIDEAIFNERVRDPSAEGPETP